MKRICIINTQDPKDEGREFDNQGQAINYLQAKGYTDYEICQVRFVPVK